MPREILIESESRWDTLELLRILPRCRWYLVEREARRWDVHVEPTSPTLVAEVLDAAARWASSRHVRSTIHVPLGENGTASRSGNAVTPPA